ncbi:MAG: EamA family transporter, partial [Spirochaetaceae bacterium]|nr:EamA family transporter [Spirochaetaceae bacterium]
ASSFINLIPVVAAFGAWLFLGEVLNIYQVAGGVVVLSGVVLSQERRVRIIEADLQGREGSRKPV